MLCIPESLKLQRNVDKYEILNHGNATEDDKNNFSYTKVKFNNYIGEKNIKNFFKNVFRNHWKH